MMRALLLVALACSIAGATTLAKGRVLLKGSHAVEISTAAPDWLTPQGAIPAAPSCTVASSDVGQVTLNCGTWSPVVRTSYVAGGVLGLSRSVVSNGDHFTVSDTFTNNDVTTFGVHVRHYTGSTSNYVHLAGQVMPSGLDKSSAWNPTAFAMLGRVGLGLVMEDDVFRIQGRTDYAHGSAGIKTDLLCLAPAQQVTLQWSIYPTATASYWDFINRVRANWGVNTTVVGPYFWFDPDTVNAYDGIHGTGALSAALAQQGIAVAVLGGGWVDPLDGSVPKVIGFGNYVMSSFFNSYRSRVLSAIAALRAARPSIRVILYFNASRDSTPSSNTVYSDSLETDINNAPISTTFGGVFSLSYNTFPTATNSYGVAMQSTAASMTASSLSGGLGADGVFWDEHETYGYSSSAASGSPVSPPWTFDQWDGVSCLLRTNGTVTSQIGEVDLLASTSRLSMASNFSFVLGNSPPLLRAWTNRGDMRMVEIQSNSGNAYFVTLSTPLGYVSTNSGWSWVLTALNNGVLPVSQLLQVAMGSLPAVTYQIMPRLYPCTPQYLQPGTIRCAERIATTTSGTHGPIGGTSSPTQYRYDSSGIEHAASWTVTGGAGAWYVTTTLATSEAAVIVRNP